MGQACLWEIRPQGPEGSTSSLSSIQLADVANSSGGLPWSLPVPSCYVRPSTCTHIPLWFAFHSQHPWPFLEARPYATRATLPIIVKNHSAPTWVAFDQWLVQAHGSEHPRSGQFWGVTHFTAPLWDQARLPSVGLSLISSPTPILLPLLPHWSLWEHIFYAAFDCKSSSQSLLLGTQP